MVKLIRLDDAGPAVKQVQQLLIRAGQTGLKADGRFGADMRRAVIAFQKAHKLKPDGAVGPKTLAVLAKLGKAGKSKPAQVRLNETQAKNLKAMEGQTKQLKVMKDQVGQCLKQSDQWEKQIQALDRQLQSVGDDAQLANIDLRNSLQKQQQTLQTISNVSKMLHDTSMAIIRKIG